MQTILACKPLTIKYQPAIFSSLQTDIILVVFLIYNSARSKCNDQSKTFKGAQQFNFYNAFWVVSFKACDHYHYRDSEKARFRTKSWLELMTPIMFQIFPQCWRVPAVAPHTGHGTQGYILLIADCQVKKSYYLRRVGLPDVDSGVHHQTPQTRKLKSNRKCLLINSSYYHHFEKKNPLFLSQALNITQESSSTSDHSMTLILHHLHTNTSKNVTHGQLSQKIFRDQGQLPSESHPAPFQRTFCPS